MGAPAFPLNYDPRYYLRRGLDEWVTGPTEIAGDLTVIRLDVDRRWQTKRGPLGDQHIIDWITLDTELEIFPDTKQNFGTAIGLFDYDFRWYVGDRVTLVSSGATDFFSDSDKEFADRGVSESGRRSEATTSATSSSADQITTQQTIASSMTYGLESEIGITFGSSFNLVPATDLTESLLLTRIGESFLMTFGVSADASTGSVGASFLLEPRSFGKTRLSRSGFDVGAAGAEGLDRKQGQGHRGRACGFASPPLLSRSDPSN